MYLLPNGDLYFILFDKNQMTSFLLGCTVPSVVFKWFMVNILILMSFVLYYHSKFIAKSVVFVHGFISKLVLLYTNFMQT